MSTNLHAFAQDGHRLPRPAPSGSLTYEPYYGLKEKPFSLSSDPRFLYRSPAHAPAFDELHAGIRRREGLIVLTGEIGTGKTTLCRAVLDSLDRRTFSTFVPDPFVTREDLLKMLLVDFGVMSVDDIKSGRLRNASRPELSYPLYEFLNTLVPLQAFAVLVIDEAQNIPLPLLEEIRILSDLEGREKLLQVVLVGQPELRANLKLPQMRQVDQRVSVRCELAPLGRDEVAGYVTCRLNVAATGETAHVEFTPEALDLVFQASGGVPRLINRVCDRALHEGFTTGLNCISAEPVVSALKHLGMDDVLPQTASPSSAAADSDEDDAEAFPPEPPEVIDRETVDQETFDREEVKPEIEEPPAPTVHRPLAAAPQHPVRLGRSFPAQPSWRERIGRKPPPAAMLALTGVVLCAATLAASSWFRLTSAAGYSALLPPAPLGPVLAKAPAFTVALSEADLARASAPAAVPKYIIQVASFEDDGRSGQLVSELAAAGYRAYHSAFDLDGEQWWQVSVGPYASTVTADADLARIREIPGYEDAALRALSRP